ASARPETELFATFTSPSGEAQEVRGFWDGGDVWRIRFLPGEAGVWRYETRSTPAVQGLGGVKGELECRAGKGATRFEKHGSIRVAASGHHFEHADGTPFFWLVDTAWNGALKSKDRDWDRYLSVRARQGFTGVQFVVTQWRTAYTSADGQVAYTGHERIQIQPEFFRRIDERVAAVNARGLLAVPVLLWTLGQKQHNPGQLPEDQAILLARYIVARYAAHHVAFFLPGDGNYFGANAERWKRIGRGVFDRPGLPPVFLHPQGMQWPYDAFLEEPWLSAHGYQSGHGDDDRTLEWLHSGPPAEKWKLEPHRPVINLEPPYEDHIAYQSRQRHTDATVRRALYWSCLNAPTAGTSYGAHGVWSWETQPAEPQEHGGTGIAKPWFQAVELPGGQQVKHLSDLFQSIRWWELRPDRALVASDAPGAPQPELTHIAYTRDRAGQCILYIEGKPAATAKVGGNCSNWAVDYRLAIANELSQDRPWRGDLYRVAIYNRALSSKEILQRHQKGLEAPPSSGIQASYLFNEGKGDFVRDRSGGAVPIDLRIGNPSAVEWIQGGGLRVKAPVLIASIVPATRLCESVRALRAITVEAWVKPADLEQAGPARIVTLSRDTSERNFTLGQKGSAYEVRFRTTESTPNGEPATSTAAVSQAARHVAAARSDKGDVAVIYLPVGDPVKVALDRLAKGLTAEWFDPRSGRKGRARPLAGGTFQPPGAGDWVLVFTAGR
ncbi:MAG: DUF4038 domain-containing protein, partial [Planctomycetes bacterium]|nr:DUF4038 domain-containing protein [Planctomycetota bacterium]